MKKMLLIIILIILPYFLWAGTTGKLTGKVTDSKTKEALIGVNILMDGTTLGTSSDINGNYVILNIHPGKYKVKVSYIGYQAIIMENVPISIDLTTTRDIELSETHIEMEAIIIEAKAEALKKDITSSQAIISSDQIKNLPVAELTDVLQLQAGVTKDASGGFHIRGGRTTEIAYWVNGISITDAYDNSQGIRIDNSSVQELQVISGTFNAEYGNAMSGIINTVTKEGSPKYSGSVNFYTSDHLSNFTTYFPYIDRYNPIVSHNFQGSLSGPFPFTSNKLRFFANARYFYDDGWLYGEKRFKTTGREGDRKITAMNWRNNYIGQANIGYQMLSDVKINGEFLYSKEDYQDYDHSFRYVPDGNVFKYANSYNGTFTLNHMLSASSFYTLKASYFVKDFNEYLYKDWNDPRYLHPDSLNTVSYAFRTGGTNLHRFFRETNTFLAKTDFTSQAYENHLIKLGVETKIHKLKFDDYTLEPLRINNIPVEPFKPSIPDENSPNRTKYLNKPIEFSGYMQDKIEYQNVIINLGIRLDYFDARGKVLVDPTDPNINIPLRPGLDSLSLAEREQYFYKDSRSKWQISPRFGIAYPISEYGVVHFSYGHFLQIPTFQYLYNRGEYKVPETGEKYGVYGNPDLEAQKTVMYEIGFRQEFLDDFLIDATAFYKDVRNWITAGPFISTRNIVTYSKYINKDYSNVKGITFIFSKRLSNYYAFDLNYTYQVAEGSNSSPEDEYYAQLGEGEPTLYLLPMDWDQRHLINFNILVGEKNWGTSLLARYGTGLPYTPAITQYTAERGITSGLQKNSRIRPPQFTIDLKLHKVFSLLSTELTAYLRIFNLLDSRTVINVFGDTGKPDYTNEAKNVGYDPKRPNTIEEYLRYPWNYAEPRNVQIGLEISF
ncbi:MAG: TonB-dependent receptor [Bacteroidota bacterium]|nr:TonB-dependent receptor [Bacteroidota bacterium]